MYKNCLLIISFFLFCFIFSLAYAKTIEAGISYTVDRARIEAFDFVAFKIDISKYKSYFLDPLNEENLKFKNKRKFVFSDRLITFFANGDYAVSYKDKKNTAYYYNKNGELRFIEFNDTGKYPRKGIKYDINGILVGTSLSITKDDQYIFDTKKKLTAHWIGRNCYNENGELIDTRD